MTQVEEVQILNFTLRDLSTRLKDKTRSAFPAVFLVGSVLALTVFLPSQSIDIRAGKNIVAECLVLFMVFSLFVKNGYLRALLVWCVVRHVMVMFFDTNGMSLAAAEQYYKTSYMTLMDILVFVTAYIAMTSGRSRLSERLALNTICTICVIQTLFMVLQTNGIWFLVTLRKGLSMDKSFLGGWLILGSVYSHSKDSILGLMCNTNTAGALLAMGLPAFLRPRWVLYVPVMLACIAISHTLGALIPALLVILIWLGYKNRKLLSITIIPGLIFLVGYVLRYNSLASLLSLSGRVDAWVKFLVLFPHKHQWIGYGLGSFKVISRLAVRNIYYVYAHNEYLQVLIELGAIGFVLVLLYLTSLFYKTVQNRSLIQFLALLVISLNCLVNFPFHTYLAWIPILYIVIIENNSKESLCR